MSNEIMGSPIIVIISSGKKKRLLFLSSQNRVSGIKAVYDGFELRGHSKIVEWGHEDDNLRLLHGGK